MSDDKMRAEFEACHVVPDDAYFKPGADAYKYEQYPSVDHSINELYEAFCDGRESAVPEGWKLVPVELVEMLRETCRFHQEQGTVLMVQMNNLALLLDQADAGRPEPPEKT